MMKRVLPAIAFGLVGFLTLVNCSSDPEPSDGIGGGLGDGSTTCTSKSCTASTSSSGGGSGTSGGSSGQGGGTSSGGGGASSGQASSSGDPRTYTRIPTVSNLPQRSAGCGNANPPARGQYTNVWDGARHYIPYQPNDYSSNGLSAGDRAGRGYPLVIAVHGCEADAIDFSTNGYGSFQDTIGSNGIVVYPEAQNAKGGCSWDFNNDQAYLDAVLQDAKNNYCIDESRVTVLGFSFGGYMSQVYSCNRPGTVKSLVSAASGYPDGGWGDIPGLDVRECGQIPVLIYGRDSDSNEPIGNSIHARDQRVTINQCDGTSGPAYWPFNAPGTFGNAGTTGCTDYNGCVNGLRTTFCEDPLNFTTAVDENGNRIYPNADDSWNHTFWQEYHSPVWAWANNLPD